MFLSQIAVYNVKEVFSSEEPTTALNNPDRYSSSQSSWMELMPGLSVGQLLSFRVKKIQYVSIDVVLCPGNT